MPTKSRRVELRGVQEPRVRLAPHAHSNSWDDVVDLTAAYGLVLDEWQENVLEGALGEQRNKRWAAPRVGLSVPRQNGKGALIEARELAGLLLFEERLIIHSAHEVKTAIDAFRRVRSYFDNFDDLRKKVKRVSQTNGQEGIELLSGQALRFMARSKGSGRGFSADCLILDEAQELADETFAAILPTISARPNPQTWLLGTPPSQLMNGEVFTRFRNGGLEGKDPRLFWAEWSSDADAELDDPRSWAQANPALGLRIDLESIRDERSAMDDRTFARERLGMWGEEAGRSVMDMDRWAELGDRASRAGDLMAFGIAASPDRERAGIVVAGRRADGNAHLEVIESGSGSAWVADRLAQLRRFSPCAVVLDPAGPAGTLLPAIMKAGVEPLLPTAREYAHACGAFVDAVANGTLRHMIDPRLTAAADGGRKRAFGSDSGLWVWQRWGAATDAFLLEAATHALHGLAVKGEVRPKPRGGFGF